MKEPGQREAARKRAEAQLVADADRARSSLSVEATREGVKPPSVTTLRRYGITASDWMALLEAQGWRCPICLKAARLVRLNVDHDHVSAWDRLAPEQRRRYVRGILCVYCNFRRVKSRMPAAEARRIADYLHAYEERRGS